MPRAFLPDHLKYKKKQRVYISRLIVCKYCASEFFVPFYRRTSALYCSRSCQAFAARVQAITICKICDTEFTHISSRANSAKYCSRKCYHKAMSTKGTVEIKCRHCESLFFTSPYDAKNRLYCSRACTKKESKLTWKASYTTVRSALLRRNLIQSCDICGYAKIPQLLGVHHKDHNRNNNELFNLQVLCPNCHSEVHAKHIVHSLEPNKKKE